MDHNKQPQSDFKITSKSISRKSIDDDDIWAIILNLIVILLSTTAIIGSLITKKSTVPKDFIYRIGLNSILVIYAIRNLYKIYDSVRPKISYTVDKKESFLDDIW